MRWRTILLFGAPGSGKGTQGKILGSIPGFCHLSCGDVFRGMDLRTQVGQAFLKYSSAGKLVPDDVTVDLWRQHMANMVTLGKFKPEIDHLVLDGIPRNAAQAKLLESDLQVEALFHLVCHDRAKLEERLKRRALRDNRLDDASDTVIHDRLQTYERETKPVLEYYGDKKVKEIDAEQFPFEVTRDILTQVKPSKIEKTQRKLAEAGV
ncbi:MAG: nucleoside monophosphate kinase [Verrucomicrobia bacterium]|jgi:adenylate kinase|nr:nucleoside monophosphate kinase [Verrucomicrobiota bacterium]